MLGLREDSRPRMQGPHFIQRSMRLHVEERLAKYFNCLGVEEDSRGRMSEESLGMSSLRATGAGLGPVSLSKIQCGQK